MEFFLNPEMPDILAQWQHYLGLLDVPDNARVLDVGCGSGDPLRLLARTAPTAREFIGLDRRFLERFAENHAIAQAEDNRIRFQEGNAQALPFADNRFDCVLCADVLEWVPDPSLALKEMRRVLKPAGVALIIHSDFDSQVYATSDRERNRRIVHAFSDAGPNGQMGRELFGLCNAAGFAAVEPSVYVLVNSEYRPDLYGYKSAQMMTEWLVEKQGFPPTELQSWLHELEQHNGSNSFFYSINRNICRCIK